jgi:hypothetical protein
MECLSALIGLVGERPFHLLLEKRGRSGVSDRTEGKICVSEVLETLQYIVDRGRQLKFSRELIEKADAAMRKIHNSLALNSV